MFSTQNLKTQLKENKALVGTWITLYHPSIAEMACNAGFDWIGIDLEHSVISISEAEQLIRTINLLDKTALVRLTSNNSDQIKRVMDAGATGIIVPMVETKDDVSNAANSMYYEPIGRRGVGLARAQGYGAKFKEYCKDIVSNGILVAQIENIKAINNLDEIFSHPLLDAYMIGPYDLSSSMGIAGQFESNEFIEVVDTINASAKKYGVPGGVHIVEPNLDLLAKSLEGGSKFITYSVDIRIMESAYSEAMNFVLKSIK